MISDLSSISFPLSEFIVLFPNDEFLLILSAINFEFSELQKINLVSSGFLLNSFVDPVILSLRINFLLTFRIFFLIVLK